MSIHASDIDLPEVIAQVTAAFHAYEDALMGDDIAAMDALFHAAPSTVRYGVGEVLYGIEAIRAFRIGRGGSPQRRL
ncbi:AtzH-like domain-containing protein, partial [Xanthomonas hortorum]